MPSELFTSRLITVGIIMVVYGILGAFLVPERFDRTHRVITGTIGWGWILCTLGFVARLIRMAFLPGGE